MAIAFDQKGRARSKWQSIRARNLRVGGQKGLTGEALHRAVMAIAATDPSLVKIERAGAA